MVNESLGAMEGVESGEIRQNVNKVTEDAVKRVQDQQKKAKQIQGDIKKDKAMNDQLANFLSFLLKDIKKESLIQHLYTVFFNVKHPKQNITYIRKTINAPLLVGVFAPFYQERLPEFKLESFYTLPSSLSLHSYITYLKQLSTTYHDNIPIDKDSLLHFLLDLLSHYHILSETELEKKEEQLKKLEKMLY